MLCVNLLACLSYYFLEPSPIQVEWINQEYGDVRIAGTNIAFPSGTIDPW